MLRFESGKNSRRERRHHPVPKRPPLPLEYEKLYQQALNDYHELYSSGKARRYNASKSRTRSIWFLRRWLKLYREGKHSLEALREIARCYAHIAVIDSRN